MSDYETVQALVEPIEGWLRPAQAQRLWDLARAVPEQGSVVEIGSFQGKSTVVLASAAPASASIHAIDPHAGNDRGPGEWEGAAEDGQADHEQFLRNLENAGVRDRVTHVREFSQLAQGHVAGPIDLLYVDGAHGYAPARSDIVEWGNRVVEGGAMAIHDVYTSLFVSLAVMRTLWFSRRWRYVGRVRSLAVYERSPVSLGAWPGNVLRQVANVPWFVKNLVVRGLGAVGLGRLARWGQAPGGGVY